MAFTILLYLWVVVFFLSQLNKSGSKYLGNDRSHLKEWKREKLARTNLTGANTIF